MPSEVIETVLGGVLLILHYSDVDVVVSTIYFVSTPVVCVAGGILLYLRFDLKAYSAARNKEIVHLAKNDK